MTSLLQRELFVIGLSYGLAAFPVAAAMLARKASPLYRVPVLELARWWSRFALAIVLTTLLCDLASA